MARSIRDTDALAVTFKHHIGAWQRSGDPTAQHRIGMLELALFSIELWKRLRAAG